MKVDEVLHMVEGSGENSYSSNSKIQENIISKANPFIREAMSSICGTLLPTNLVVSDLGCSSGPNTFTVMTEIIDVIQSSCHQLKIQMPEVQIFLNDLPQNDFNSIFITLSSYKEKVKEMKGGNFVPFYVAGVAGSFYNRLFLRSSIHFIHSSSSIHWLSQVPQNLENDEFRTLNKKYITVTKSSNPYISEAYSDQFQRDFTKFLKFRGEELVPGGRMVLTVVTRDDKDILDSKYHNAAESLAEAFEDLVSEGLIEESKVHTFNLPIYAPCVEEVQEVIDREGSFHLDHLEIFQSTVGSFDRWDQSLDNVICANNFAKSTRAALEPILASHFGTAIMDGLFTRYAEILAHHLLKEKVKLMHLVISLINRTD